MARHSWPVHLHGFSVSTEVAAVEISASTGAEGAIAVYETL